MTEQSRRQSLVTPIDWKLDRTNFTLSVQPSRQSLVTPIDWKLPLGARVASAFGFLAGRQSLVTPIDWKPNWS